VPILGLCRTITSSFRAVTRLAAKMAAMGCILGSQATLEYILPSSFALGTEHHRGIDSLQNETKSSCIRSRHGDRTTYKRTAAGMGTMWRHWYHLSEALVIQQPSLINVQDIRAPLLVYRAMRVKLRTSTTVRLLKAIDHPFADDLRSMCSWSRAIETQLD
jgi:hypothetical protein